MSAMPRWFWPLVVGWALIAMAFTWGWDEHSKVARLQEDKFKAMDARAFRESELLNFIRQLSADAHVFTNDTFLVWYWTDLSVLELPYTAKARHTLGPGTSINEVRALGGWLVWFENGCQDYLPPDSFLDVVERTPNGMIRGYQDSTGIRMLIEP